MSHNKGNLASQAPFQAISSGSSSSRSNQTNNNRKRQRSEDRTDENFPNVRVSTEEIIAYAKAKLEFTCERSAADLISDMANEFRGNRTSMIHSRLLAIKQKEESRLDQVLQTASEPERSHGRSCPWLGRSTGKCPSASETCTGIHRTKFSPGSPGRPPGYHFGTG